MSKIFHLQIFRLDISIQCLKRIGLGGAVNGKETCLKFCSLLLLFGCLSSSDYKSKYKTTQVIGEWKTTLHSWDRGAHLSTQVLPKTRWPHQVHTTMQFLPQTCKLVWLCKKTKNIYGISKHSQTELKTICLPLIQLCNIWLITVTRQPSTTKLE